MILSRRIFAVVLCVSTLACDQIERVDFKGPAQGFRPVYQPLDDLQIEWRNARALSSPGKIYVYGNNLFVNEVGIGIHVFDNSDPSTPEATGFISVPGNTDLAIKDGVLYSNYMNKVISIRLNDYSNLEKLDEISFSNSSLNVPPPAGFYFDCIDPEKGIITRWLPVEITNPECYAI